MKILAFLQIKSFKGNLELKELNFIDAKEKKKFVLYLNIMT
ncbi:unnamed protein product [Paramecium sonneborni]|uniref:Uncharacterized protein n=1 Tax=Paramecium sonneborni TaxID=65129 RepID=A0A8S1MR86_9CILI|nr:unnamed protein product [Paramecium sonneborni]